MLYILCCYSNVLYESLLLDYIHTSYSIRVFAVGFSWLISERWILSLISLCKCVFASSSLLLQSHSYFSLMPFSLPPPPFISLSPADPEWSLHDCAERPCSGLYIWGWHVRFSGAAKPGDAFKSQQLPLPWAKAYSFCGLIGLPAKRVGNFAQLPQGLHFTCEFASSHVQITSLGWTDKMLLRFWGTCV